MAQDKANQMKEKEPVGIMEPPRKQTLLTTKYKSDSDIPDSNKDVDKDKKVEDDEANQVEGMKSVELAKLPRKQGNTEAEDDEARTQPSGKKQKEDSTREKLVREANKQTPFDISRIKGNESKRKASIKCEANGSRDNARNNEKTSDIEEKDNDPKEKSFANEIGLSGSDSAHHQPDKQDGSSDPMDCLPDKKKLEETPGIVVSKFGTNDGQSEDTKALKINEEDNTEFRMIRPTR